MMKALEEVHRTLALQEFRRRRDKLALDNVRLGRTVSIRTTVRTCYILAVCVFYVACFNVGMVMLWVRLMLLTSHPFLIQYIH